MEKLAEFCTKIKDAINNSNNLSMAEARQVVKSINDFLYTNYPGIDKTLELGVYREYFSDFHKFWKANHKEILDCKIDDEKCELVADSLHDVYFATNGEAFKSVWDKCGLTDEEVCRIRFLTANQDFRGSRSFSDLAHVYESDYTIFDENNIKEDPENFLRLIEGGRLSQNDKRITYARNISEFLLTHNCTPYEIINEYNRDIFALRNAMIACNAGYGNKKADMFVRDMVVLGIWTNVNGFENIDVASDVNTIKVALRTGIINTKIPLVSSFLDIFCYQYSYIDIMNAKAWRRVWEIWNRKYPGDRISSPCLLDYFVYNVVGRQFCRKSLNIFKGDNCGHIFRWHSGLNRTCQICHNEGERRQPASVINKVMPCCDEKGYVAIDMTEYVRALPVKQKIHECPFTNICADKKHLMPPKSISILGQTGWISAYARKDEGGGGLMA